jgi:hypothetical protein
LAVGISTAAYIEPDLSSRIALIDAWTVLPDFVSVNLSEPGIEQVMAVLCDGVWGWRLVSGPLKTPGTC